MSLADDLIDDIGDVFLDTEDFAEAAAYTPKGGAARSITVVVTDDNSRRANEAHHLTDVRTIRVLAKRDAEAGIDTPSLGDRLVRSAEPTVGWDFQSLVEVRPGHYVLQYTSTSLKHSGQVRPADL